MIAAMLLALSGAHALAVRPAPTDQSTAARDCIASRALLIGSWTQDGINRTPSDIFPEGDSRVFQFEIEGRRRVFREYLHDRPGTEGRWILSGCRLSILHGESRPEHYELLRLTRQNLRLRMVGQRTVESFSRIVD